MPMSSPGCISAPSATVWCRCWDRCCWTDRNGQRRTILVNGLLSRLDDPDATKEIRECPAMSIALITGSAGLIGSEAACFFAAQGLDVVGIDNNLRQYFF